VAIASSGPITVGIPGLVAKLRGRKLVFEARDLWPEGAVKMGLLKNSLMIKLMYAFEKLCYKSSHTIIGLSPGIQQNIQSRFPTCRVASVTNAANLNLFSNPLSPPPELETGSYAIYFGNIGEVNHSGYLLDAASILLQQGRLDITTVIIGEGQLKNALIARVAKEKLTNVLVLNLMPKSAVVRYVQHALVSVVPFKPIPVFDTMSPNKFFESMAAGIPVVQTTQGWIKDFIAVHQIGYTVNGHDPNALAEKMIFLKDNPQLAQEMGKRARHAAETFFDKDHLADKMLNILKAVHEN
jgi:glycosyltransferase involved in cell wall biosynthesis